MVSKLEYGQGHALFEYWAHGEGFPLWSTSPTPWTTLTTLLRNPKFKIPPEQINGEATNIMMATPAGLALFKAHHQGHRAVTMSGNEGTVLPTNATIVTTNSDDAHEAALTKILAAMSPEELGAFSQLCDDACEEMGA